MGLVAPRDKLEMNETVVDALTEATLINFANGRWLFSENKGSHYFKICECRVPDFSDYRDLREWLYRRKTGKTKDSNSLSLHSLSGLSYAVHLLRVLAEISDVNLPFALSPARLLCMVGVTEDKLNTILLQLNTNVCILCYSQGLMDAGVSLCRPLCNLYTISQNINATGAVYSFVLPQSFLDDFQTELGKFVWTEDEHERAPSETQLGAMPSGFEGDWEQVSEELPTWSGMTPHSSSSALTTLITSATSSVTQLFRNT